MGFDLNALATKTAVTDVHFMGQKARVTYNPSYLTSENIALSQSGKDEDFVVFFTTLVKGWDVMIGKSKVPLTKAGLQKVPIILLKAIFSTIMNDAGKGDEEEGKASSAG